MSYAFSQSVRLTPGEAAAAIDAVVGIDWMTNSASEWNRKGNYAISVRLDCSTENVEPIWRRLRDERAIDPKSEFSLAESGSMNSPWKR